MLLARGLGELWIVPVGVGLVCQATRSRPRARRTRLLSLIRACDCSMHGLTQDRPGTKRDMSMRTSVSAGESPARKKPDYSHFKKGRKSDPVLASIPECAREIIMDGHRTYMPMHYWSDEMLEAEEDARIVLRVGDNESARHISITANEATMSTTQFSSWAGRHTRALRKLQVDEDFCQMFEKHYTYIIAASDFETAWPRYRTYSIKKRRMVKGDDQEDIRDFDQSFFDAITAKASNKVLNDLEHALARVEAQASGRGRGSGNRVPTTAAHDNAGSSRGPSVRRDTTEGADSLLKFVFNRCFVCGSRDHTFKRATPIAKRCTPRYLTVDATKHTFTPPGAKDYVCFGFNTPAGCKRAKCRHVHCCSLCGSKDHGAATCV